VGRVYPVSTNCTLMWIREVYILYKGDGLGLSVCACYSWEKALNFGLVASFYNLQD
jgi:hypothetical protein